jgi:hypothetical protein
MTLVGVCGIGRGKRCQARFAAGGPDGPRRSKRAPLVVLKKALGRLALNIHFS